MGISIEGIVASKVGFASHQNAVPLLRELSLTNDGELDYQQLTVELLSTLPFIDAKCWHLDRLTAGSMVRVMDRNLN